MGLSCSKTLENFNCNNKIYFQYIPLCSYHTDIKEAEKESINLQNQGFLTSIRKVGDKFHLIQNIPPPCQMGSYTIFCSNEQLKNLIQQYINNNFILSVYKCEEYEKYILTIGVDIYNQKHPYKVWDIYKDIEKLA